MGLGLVLAGAVLVIRRRRGLWPLVVAAVIFLLFELGNQPPLPWWLLKHLPIYSGLRVPSRFTIVAGLFMCLLAGVAVDELGAAPLARAGGWRWPRSVGWAALVLALVYLFDAASFNRLQWDAEFGSPPPRDPRAASFHQVPGDRGRMMAFPRANEGTLSCFEETPLPISPLLRGNLAADEYLADPVRGKRPAPAMVTERDCARRGRGAPRHRARQPELRFRLARPGRSGGQRRRFARRAGAGRPEHA